MPDERIVTVSLTAEEIGVREANSEFEDKAAEAAFKKVVVVEGENTRVKDIEPSDGGYLVHVVCYKPSAKPVIEEKVEPTVEDDDKKGLLPTSKAKEGPLKENVWEIDVVELCAALDLIALAELFMQPPPNGKGLNPALLSIYRLRSFLLSCVGDVQEDTKRTTADGKQVVSVVLSKEFLEHYKKWAAESHEEFAKIVGENAGKKIVQARMVPGSGFNPKA